MAAGTPEWPSMTEGEWNKIATGVLTGSIDRLNSQYKYYVTSVVTAAAAPIAAIKEKSPVIFEDGNQEPIGSQVAIDVYIWPEDVTDSGATITDTIQVNV